MAPLRSFEVSRRIDVSIDRAWPTPAEVKACGLFFRSLVTHRRWVDQCLGEAIDSKMNGLCSFSRGQDSKHWRLRRQASLDWLSLTFRERWRMPWLVWRAVRKNAMAPRGSTDCTTWLKLLDEIRKTPLHEALSSPSSCPKHKIQLTKKITVCLKSPFVAEDIGLFEKGLWRRSMQFWSKSRIFQKKKRVVHLDAESFLESWKISWRVEKFTESWNVSWGVEKFTGELKSFLGSWKVSWGVPGGGGGGFKRFLGSW